MISGSTPDGAAGFTCQSFSSLSLDPPMVVVLPGHTSTSWPVVAATGRFCVNILAAHQGHISDAFARSGTDKFAGLEHRRSPAGNPVLDGVCAWIDCDVVDVHPGGDHLIVVGAVTGLEADHTACDPLIFHRGRYLTGASS